MLFAGQEKFGPEVGSHMDRVIHTRDWEPVTIHFKHSHWWKRPSWSKFASHYAWGTNGSIWMRDECKVYMDSYMAPNGLCLMVTWIIFKNHVLEVGLTQNLETTALWTITIVGLFYFYHVWRPTWIEIHWNNIWLRARSHMTSQHLRAHDRTTWAWRCVGMAFGHFLLGSHNFMATTLICTPHTYWCGPLVNDSYQQGTLLELF